MACELWATLTTGSTCSIQHVARGCKQLRAAYAFGSRKKGKNEQAKERFAAGMMIFEDQIDLRSLNAVTKHLLSHK